MKSLTSTQADSQIELGAKRLGMMLFELPSGNYGVWDGSETISWNGFTFKPGGRLLQIERGIEKSGLEANGMTIKLYAIPESDLTPEVLYTIHAENYRNRAVTVWTALFNVDTGVRIDDPILEYRGTIQSIDSVEDGGEVYIEAKVASRNQLNTDSNNTMANAAHHAIVSPGDNIFKYAGAITNVPIFFGRAAPADWKPTSRVQG